MPEKKKRKRFHLPGRRFLHRRTQRANWLAKSVKKKTKKEKKILEVDGRQSHGFVYAALLAVFVRQHVWGSDARNHARDHDLVSHFGNDPRAPLYVSVAVERLGDSLADADCVAESERRASLD